MFAGKQKQRQQDPDLKIHTEKMKKWQVDKQMKETSR